MGITLLVCLTNRRPEGVFDACEEEHDEDFEDMPASKLADPSARFPADAADAIKGIVKSKDAKSLCHEKARKRLDLPSVLEALEKLLSSSPPPVEDAPQLVAPEASTATPQPTPTLLLREIGKAAVTDPQEEAERRLQHYAAKGFNDFMRILERRYGTAPPEKEFEKVRCISHLARTPLSPIVAAPLAARLLARGQVHAGVAARPAAPATHVAQRGRAPRRAALAPRRPKERRGVQRGAGANQDWDPEARSQGALNMSSLWASCASAPGPLRVVRE